MNKFCLSCGIPVAQESESNYCEHCVNEHGELKSRDEVQAGIAAWLKLFTPDPEDVDFNGRAASYMNAMPAWAE